MLKLFQRFKQWLYPKRTPSIPPRRKTSVPTIERRVAASRNIVDGSLMDKPDEQRKETEHTTHH